MFNKSTLFAAMLAMAPFSANAHMIMASPVPYGHPNNSPLDASGSDYPCKAGPYTIVTMNDWKVGSTQKLFFTGTAVHGGGSCQVSVTKDKEPTKDSKFKVIYSIEGGCPANFPANYPEGGPNYDGYFPFTVPPELPNGQMTMAWTWMNKVGNREFYMNCAPITVSGGATDTKAFDALPDMVVANINVPAAGTCKTKETFDYTFANPGKYKTSTGFGPWMDPCSTGDKSTAPTPSGGGGAVNAGNPVPDAAPAAGSGSGAEPPVSGAPVAGVPAAPASSAVPVSSAAPVASAPAPNTTLRTIATVPKPPYPANNTSAPAPTGQLPTASAPAPVPTGAAPGGNGTPCPTNGAIICSLDGTQFGICNFGKALMMSVATGTKCVNGAIARRDALYSHRNMRTAI
ncbi:lytic polysaccharide monooxygenase [Pyrenophora tritici-repentis]|uniref:FAP multi-domain protein n=2 Tax=Pyrenophora tritici-repentis TaxID=45151 RepID=A0A2W1EUI2_9PLEO|nr:uncharacterized protein PTRG_00673 [Pyrenophora tritici-repentis Pt-1C-BFP]KAA8625285.1 hypothetical protein PtrV1_00965 [Pyrenophora tritici-repentis]EDU40111.1 conserved hypothetical protein [Pyrenophora tritici-repentis Pt-1C-BFP]KAF7453684.1 hypothetical protein A1F99_009420 [Pyrenophora tritici-repentis]KAF7576772.1 FAP multi-domain protein [Pyrenophora tritici-repentis]KAG9387445.1 hypothetical protein A1F94_000337 [Pyrenophora tritici-repentis]